MTKDEILKNELLDSIEFVGELDRIEGKDGELARVFKSQKRNSNDTTAPVTEINKRNEAKDIIWDVVENKAEKMANKRGITEELAICKILDDNPDIYRQIKNLTNASENRKVDIGWN